VILAAPVFFGVILITRYVSLGSLLGSATMIPAVALVFLVLTGSVPPAYLLYAVIGVAVVWIAHADNIDRLLHGTERKFDLSLLSGDGGGTGGVG
jgi:acyl phosphate:glycerol-3-phosphate acyltransferase